MQAGSGLNGGVSSNGSGNSALNNRQAYLSFGDKSWGSIKLGKDLGIFASDAILNDMTLLGVGGNPAAAAGLTTLGRIGNGLVYADWKGQAAYTTPNMNGFQATVGLTQAFDATSSTGAGSSGTYSYDQNNLFTFSPVLTDGTAITISGKNYVVKASGGSFSLEYNGSPALPSDLPGSMTGTYTTGSTSAVSGTYKGQLGYEGKASYSFAEDNVNGEIWVSGIAQRIKGTSDSVASAFDIGANVNFAGNVGLTGYYYEGNGIGTTHQFKDGYSTNGRARDSVGGYVQATTILPTETKVGLSWGVSNLKLAGDETTNSMASLVKENEMLTVGAYHPRTKHLNLVAEYSRTESQNQAGARNKGQTVSLGAILFF